VVKWHAGRTLVDAAVWHNSGLTVLLMETLLQDLRYAVRTLFRTPGWTAMAVLTLAIGTGANAAVFSFVDALLFRPAPAVRPARPLVTVFTSDFSSGPYGSTSYPDFTSFVRDTTAFAALAAFDDAAVAPMRAGEDVQRVRVARVSGGYFDVLGLRTMSGRPLNESDTAAGAPPAAVISATLWDRAFHASASAIGTSVTINGSPFTIVGIAPRKFVGIDAGTPLDVWVPLIPPADAPSERGNRGVDVIGQLRDGISLTAAQAQLDTLAARLANEYPKTNRGTLSRPSEPRPFLVMQTTRISPEVRGQVVMLGAVLMGGVGLVLLLACANVASLLLSRTTTRARELAVRRALGASGRRLLRQMLTETLVIAAASAILGLIFAAWTAEILPSFFPPEIGSALDATPGWRVALFAMALAAASAVLVGVIPAVRAIRPPLAASLRGAAGDITERTASRSRTTLVVAQVAIACTLLVTAALLAQSVANQLHADYGFRTRAALLSTVEVPSGLGVSGGQQFYRQSGLRVAALPGVESVAWVRTLPFSRGSRRGFRPEGYTARQGEDLELNYNIVSPDYFLTMGIPVLAGRSLAASDLDGGQPVVVVNEKLARRFFDGAAVGRHLTDSRGTALEIVGVVQSGKWLTVAEDAPPIVYYPLSQAYSPRMSIAVRTGGAPEPLAGAVRRELRAAGGEVAVYRTVTLTAHVQEALGAERLSASLVSTCGILAAALAIVGLYGAVAYLVARRTREIGVRVALGAQPRHVVLLVVRHGLGIAMGGIGIGLVAAAGVAALLQSMLYGVTPTNPSTHAVVALLLTAVALLAAYIPARRAVRIDPARALTHD
jgi:putative ABC transport system permease protein